MLDTSVMTHLLNGELWQRAKSTLVEHLKALVQAGIGIESLPIKDKDLKRSLAVYRRAVEDVPRQMYHLSITPTVEYELTEAEQVQG